GPPAVAAAIPGVAPVDVALSPVDPRQAAGVSAGRQGSCRSWGDAYGRLTAAAYTRAGFLALQSSAPPALGIAGNPIPLPGAPVSDPGRDLFYAAPINGPLACTSCHPEAGDDGLVWTFKGLGPRRTQHLRGGLLGTAPFHWSGDLPDLASLVKEVFVK